MEHPVLTRIRREGFVALGWFAPEVDEKFPEGTRFVILIGNAGRDMFRRFAREGRNAPDPLDRWSRTAVDALAADMDATALYPFDQPALPFLTWARRGGGGHVSPLGLNIHATYGLWHAYRAALLFPVAFDLPPPSRGAHPCETCRDRPCLSACPVQAFDGETYHVGRCVDHIASVNGALCMEEGCLARRACPVGRAYTYDPPQMRFHMGAFRAAQIGSPRQETFQ